MRNWTCRCLFCPHSCPMIPGYNSSKFRSPKTFKIWVICRFGICPFMICRCPRFQVLLAMTASHSPRICTGVSSPSSQSLQGCITRLRFLECFLSMKCPVNKPVNLFNLLLLRTMSALNLLKFQRPKSSLPCLCRARDKGS